MGEIWEGKSSEDTEPLGFFASNVAQACRPLLVLIYL